MRLDDDGIITPPCAIHTVCIVLEVDGTKARAGVTCAAEEADVVVRDAVLSQHQKHGEQACTAHGRGSATMACCWFAKYVACFRTGPSGGGCRCWMLANTNACGWGKHCVPPRQIHGVHIGRSLQREVYMLDLVELVEGVLCMVHLQGFSQHAVRREIQRNGVGTAAGAGGRR